MDFAFTEEQEELRSTARAFLSEHSGSEAVRAAMESELGYDPGLWKQLGAELGWTAVTIPEDCGGLGLSQVELVALLEIMGEHLLCSPFFASLCLGANAILTAGSESQRQELLPGIAEGDVRATLALTEGAGRWDVDGIETTAERKGGEYVLRGAKRFVVDGHCADLIIVAARAPRSKGEDGVSLFALPADAPGLVRTPLPGMDRTRRLAALGLHEVRVPVATRLGDEGAAAPALQRTLDLACAGLAAEQVGGAQRCLDLSVEHAKERVQFGRAIGSFQAVKHMCADMMVAVETGRSAAYYAGCAAAEGSDELALVAPLAKAWCSDAFFRCAADAIQVHGGVGFTWEYDVHLYFKRARAGASLLGEPSAHRERVARGIGL